MRGNEMNDDILETVTGGKLSASEMAIAVCEFQQNNCQHCKLDGKGCGHMLELLNAGAEKCTYFTAK